MIKAILQAMPTFTMGCFKLPKSLYVRTLNLLFESFGGDTRERTEKFIGLGGINFAILNAKGGLGFKDIENFNLALLGKQVWRLLHNMDSLFYKVFKAKYFPNCSMLGDNVGQKGSYAWQSILKAREVVRLGDAWRIGDEKKVRIRGDKWLPGQQASQVLSPQKHFPSNSRVCALIDEANPSWIVNRFQDEFLPFEAEAILSIPLSTRSTEDTLIWRETNYGTYSTKIAYRLLAETSAAAKPGSSNPQAHKAFWQKLWNLDVPNKVRHFMWRACNESLPTKLNLFKRKVTAKPTRDRCHCENEDTIHALWGCISLQEIWWEEQTCKIHLHENFANFRDLFQGFVLYKRPMLAETFAILAWSIWFNRNAKRMGKSFLPNHKIYCRCNQAAMEVPNGPGAALDPPSFPEHHPPHWHPLTGLTYKVNFDGAIFQDVRLAVIGIVIHDSKGEVIAALSEKTYLPPTVEDIYALACRRAMSFAHEVGLRDVVIEVDSETIIKHLNSESDCLASFGNIVEDSKCAALNFRSCSLSHVERNGNVVAVKLAKLAKHSIAPQIWLEDIHSDAPFLVCVDKSFC